MVNILILFSSVFIAFVVSYFTTFAFDSDKVWPKIVAVLLTILWVVYIIYLNYWQANIFEKMHDNKGFSSQVSIVISLFTYLVTNFIFNAPSFFGNLHGYHLTLKAKIIKAVTQLGSISFAPAFYWWQVSNGLTLVDYFCKYVVIMFIGVAFMLVVAIITWKSNLIRDFLYQKYDIKEHILESRFKFSEDATKLVDLISKNGFVSKTDVDNQNMSFEKGFNDLINLGIPMNSYKLSSGELIYTYGDDKDIAVNPRNSNIPFQYMVKTNFLVPSKFIQEVSEKTRAKEKDVKDYIMKHS